MANQIKNITVDHKFVIGLDLGQVNDYTALIVLERSQEVITETVPVPDFRDRAIIRQWSDRQVIKDAFYDCIHVDRYKLGMSYPDIIDDVKDFIATRVKGQYILVVDQTGVGRPVFDLVTKAGLDAVGVTITGGEAVTWGRREARVAKRILVSTLQAVVQTKRLRLPNNMRNVDILQKEIMTFDYKMTESANIVYGAREGAHDDLVLSLALALWMGEKYGNPQKVAQQIKGY